MRRRMTHCSELAAQGVGQVSPPSGWLHNHRSTENIVGEGFYLYDGLKYAETIVGASCGSCAAERPCLAELHRAPRRTAPCTDALIQAGVRRVVVNEDPNPRVSARASIICVRRRIEVCTGLMAGGGPAQ
jgi:diaminohydroxyphosphoribosylaminopyrimidine deaminase/5-amino-6-(5-phosphoribosylamino)uracil reductase